MSSKSRERKERKKAMTFEMNTKHLPNQMVLKDNGDIFYPNNASTKPCEVRKGQEKTVLR